MRIYALTASKRLSSALDQLEECSVPQIWCECRQRVVDTAKPKKFFLMNKKILRVLEQQRLYRKIIVCAIVYLFPDPVTYIHPNFEEIVSNVMLSPSIFVFLVVISVTNS